MISTHTPHARRDVLVAVILKHTLQFQLTRLMRGVTSRIALLSPDSRISTHTPHARRDPSFLLGVGTYSQNFNSHASCEA